MSISLPDLRTRRGLQTCPEPLPLPSAPVTTESHGEEEGRGPKVFNLSVNLDEN